MPSPIIQVDRFAFTSLLPEVNPEVVEFHLTKLAETLRDFYPIVEISPDEIMAKFRQLFADQNSRVLYGRQWFHVGTGHQVDSWVMVLYLTKVPHFETGIVETRHVPAPVDPQLAYKLVERGLASTVTCRIDAGARRGLLTRVFRPNMGLHDVGEVTGTYLIAKIGVISTLRKKWKWEALGENVSWFSEFFSEVARILRAANTESTVTIPLHPARFLRDFVARCDAQVRAALESSRLEQQLAAVDVTLDEWFAA